jgi:ABC-type multidrug transport system ATPase subunit
LFVLRTPPWWQRKKYPDDWFWGAHGVVRTFLDKLYDLALAPIKHSVSRTTQQVYLYVRDLACLHQLAQQYRTNANFFMTLESTYISDLIEEVRIRVSKPGVPSGLTFAELSEGAQQLVTVLGLLRFTKEDESLFLLDEPDTHLNPAWKLEYMSLLRKFAVGETESSQIILATHDPIVIGGLKKEQVRILVKGKDGRITSEPPDKDPAGMGVAALLTSDVFGLASSLDLVTQGKLDKQRRLAVKSTKGPLTPEEQQELEKLNEEMKDLGFTRSFRDPLYTRFVEALSEHEAFQKPVLTPEERDEQARIAREIVKQLQEEVK